MHTNPCVAAALSILLLAACATQRQTETAIGTGAGAAAGAVLGTAIGGTGRGTVVGAAVGAAAGGAIGYNWQAVKEKLGIATRGSGVEVREQADGSLRLNVPGSISFDSGSAAIRPAFYATLDKIAATLAENRDTTITVTGHTDSTGSAQFNLDLSRARAGAVVSYLAGRGVARSRMVADGRGEAEPIADNASEQGRARNRRVEITLRPIQR
ncbi:MAG: OmpA family protein [Rhodocyclaceae bacterium]